MAFNRTLRIQLGGVFQNLVHCLEACCSGHAIQNGSTGVASLPRCEAATRLVGVDVVKGIQLRGDAGLGLLLQG